MIKAIAITLLFAVAMSATYKDTKTVLAEIDANPFGNTMLSMISLNLATKAPLDDVIVVVDQIMSGLEDNAKEEDAIWVANKEDCDTTIPNLQVQIAETSATIKQLEQAISENEEILSQAKKDLKQAEADYEETVKAIEVGTAERQAAHEKWANEDYDMTIQITTLDEGVKLINHMLHGVAFSQIQSRYEKVVDQLKNQKGSHASLFQPLITSLTQLATKLNYDNVMNILALLNDIRTSISQRQQEARAEEEAAQAAWESALKQLEAQKKALAEKRKRLEALIAATEKYLAECRVSLENNRVNLENLKISLANKTEQCNNWEAEHNAYVEEYEREADILGKLREHVIEKNQQVSDYTANRAANAPGF